MQVFDFAIRSGMQAVFGLNRESNNTLFFKNWENDSGIFHFHSQIELYFVDDGEMEVTIGDSTKVLGKSQMSVALSYTPHAYKTINRSTSSTLIIPMYFCEEFIEATNGKRATDPFITDTKTVQLIKNYATLLMRKDINDIERKGYIYVILGILMSTLTFEDTDAPPNDYLASKLLFYINENFKNDISPASVAAHFGYTQSHVSRCFRGRFNITMIKYLTIVRLKNALMLMYERKHSITYCALESGFSSVRTFYRAFSEEFSCSPKEYMKQF